MRRLASTSAVVLLCATSMWVLPARPAKGPCELPRQDGERKDYARLSNSCAKCHADVHAEHLASGHATSWTDPIFQAEIKAAPLKADSCARCHAPRDLLDAELGTIPTPRTTARDLGVSCITCHMKQNEYFGPFASKGHGGVQPSAFYRESKMCASCHGQPEARAEHEQFSSYATSTAAKEGVTCQKCHMPEVKRELVTDPKIRPEFKIGVADCRKHTFGGTRHQSLVAGAAELKLRQDKSDLVVSVTPKTGHAFPASYGRKAILSVVWTGADGALPAVPPVIFEAPKSALAPGAVNERRFAMPKGATGAKVTLTHVSPVVAGRAEPDRQLVGETTLLFDR